MELDLAGKIAQLGPDEIAETTASIVVVDRLVVKSGVAQRLADSLDTALRYGKDVVTVLIEEKRGAALHPAPHLSGECGFAYPEREPGLLFTQ